VGFSFPSGGAVLNPGVNVKTAYGAKGDGVTDDTTAIRNAINTEVANCQTAGTYYAELFFPPGIYVVNGAYVQGGATRGNSILPLPVIATTIQKVTLVIRGSHDASALPHWQQTVTQKNGAVLKTTRTDGTNDGTYGEASILGGPTPAQGYGFDTSVFSNMLLTVDGLVLVAPANPTVSGLDARGLAEFNFGTLGFEADQNPTNATIPAHAWQFGVGMPQSNNNDNCNGLWYSCEGAYFGILVAEHTCIQSVRCIYCTDGIYFQHGTTFHGSWIGYASIEACAVCLNGSTSNSFSKVYIDVLDFENGAGGFAPQAHIYDPNNLMFGKVGLATNDAISTLVVSGAANLEVKSLQAGIGHVTAPGLPATTVTLVNPFWRDAAVTITGGTVTAIAVDGTASGLTSGTVIVPSGKSITLTYSVAPTWTWVIF
jgi:hypothetical protein